MCKEPSEALSIFSAKSSSKMTVQSLSWETIRLSINSVVLRAMPSALSKADETV